MLKLLRMQVHQQMVRHIIFRLFPIVFQMLPLLVLKIVLLGIIFAVAWIFLLGICRTGDESMNPAIRAGDLVIYDRLTHEYHMGDVVVIERDGDRQIRRVAAVSGDVVDVTEEGLNVNGYQQQEADIYTETLPYKDGIDYPLTVGDGQVFVLGDNRDQSEDSRNADIGNVKTEDIYGKAWFVSFPWENFGPIPKGQ